MSRPSIEFTFFRPLIFFAIMSKIMLKTNEHVKFCKQINDKVSKEDWDRLDVATFVTSSEKKAFFASTPLKILSPLYCEITKDLERDEGHGHLLILPDFESSTVSHLLDLVSKGETDSMSGNYDQITRDIVSLADALEINMPAITLNSDLKKTNQVKLRDIGQLTKQSDNAYVNNNNNGSGNEGLTQYSEETKEVADVLVCGDCGQGFSLEESDDHVDGNCKKGVQGQKTTTSIDDGISSSNLKNQCTPCGTSFKTGYDRRRHMYYVHGYCFDCNNCDAIFSTQSFLESHKKLVHGLGPFTCEVFGCGLFFNSKANLFLHHHRQHRMTMAPYMCKVCRLQFSGYDLLTHHLRRSHFVRIDQNDYSKKDGIIIHSYTLSSLF